jgi:N-acetylglucosamine repressor
METNNGSARAPLLRRLNAREVLAALQRHGPLSRADIARRSGVSGPTVTRAVAALLTSGLLEEADGPRPALGRPGKVVRLADTAVCVLGLVVGARECTVVAAGLDGRLRDGAERRFPTPRDYAGLLTEAVRQAKTLAKEGGTAVRGLGVCVPGPLNRRLGRTEVSPNVHQLDGRRFGHDLRKKLSWEVALLQESHALCLAERTYGAAVGVDDFAMLDVSEGCGLGVVQGGRLLEGRSGLAGEVGHVTVELEGAKCGCGNRGCLETVATDDALAAAVSRRLGRKMSLEDILTQVQSGRLRIDDELRRVTEYLAVGLAAVINIFNPSKLFLYGRLLDAGPDVFDRVLEQARRRALGPSWADCEVVRARGSKRLGAVAGIIDRLTAGREGAVGPR